MPRNRYLPRDVSVKVGHQTAVLLRVLPEQIYYSWTQTDKKTGKASHYTASLDFLLTKTSEYICSLPK